MPDPNVPDLEGMDHADMTRLVREHWDERCAEADTPAKQLKLRLALAQQQNDFMTQTMKAMQMVHEDLERLSGTEPGSPRIPAMVAKCILLVEPTAAACKVIANCLDPDANLRSVIDEPLTDYLMGIGI